MGNRHERRAKAKIEGKKLTVPNLSGDSRNCANCKFSVPRDLQDRIDAAVRHNVLEDKTRTEVPRCTPEDEAWCIVEPQVVQKMVWGFCHKHEPRENA